MTYRIHIIYDAYVNYIVICLRPIFHLSSVVTIAQSSITTIAPISTAATLTLFAVLQSARHEKYYLRDTVAVEYKHISENTILLFCKIK